MNKEKLLLKIEESFRSKVQNDRKIKNAYMLIHSDKLNIHFKSAQGKTNFIHVDQPYHIASCGKLFTSIVVAILHERKQLSYDDEIIKYLDDKLLENLHVYKGVDYTCKIKIKHLLNHTSGLHDYFSDKPNGTTGMIEKILNEPDKPWIPDEVVTWSKDNLKSHFPPGKGFHYSDTGYHIIGMIIEKVTSKSFGDVLKELIFDPLEMNQTYLYGYTNPMSPAPQVTAGLYVGDQNVIEFKSLSIDYAGGGIISTSEDLLKFMKAIVSGKIIKKESFEKLKDWAKFSIGINYGYGIMNFYAIPPLYPKKYEMWGNAGSTGSYMFYNEKMDLYMIGSLNQFGYAQKGIRSLFGVMRNIQK